MASEPAREPAARRAFVVQFKETLQKRGLLDDVTHALPPAARQLLHGPEGDDWVPETALVTLLETARGIWPGGVPAWCVALEEESLRGVNRFGRLFLRYSTLNMALSALPQAWQFTHRTGMMSVRWEGPVALVAYRAHPPLASVAYQELTVAVLRAILTLNRARADITVRPSENPASLFVVEVRAA